MGRMRRLVVVAVLLVACGILPAHAQTLSLAFKQGDTDKYSLQFNGTFSVNAGAIAQDVKFDAKAKETVAITSVESDGTADVTVTLADLTITTTGKSPDGSTSTTTTTQTNAIPPQQLRVAPDGRILSINGESISSESPFGVLVGGELAYAVLPDSAVKPGDKWSKSYDQAQPGGGSSVQVTSNSTYLRDESFHGVNAAVIETKSTADFTMSFGSFGPPAGSPAGNPGAGTAAGGAAMQGTVMSDTTSWIDPGAHRVLKSTMTANLKASITGLEGGPPTVSPNPGAIIAGPITITGTQSLDLDPA
jgi:hypothetical protein